MYDMILQYVEPIYRFCRKRLSSEADAEDLSQEILLCILQGMKHSNISNMNGYVWRIAHNRYARKIRCKNDDPIILYGHDYYPEIIDVNEQNDIWKSIILYFLLCIRLVLCIETLWWISPQF